MENLTQTLWRERELLELLLYKLETEQLVLAAGRTRWLAHAAREIEFVMGQLREVSLLRATVAAEAAATVKLPEDASLREIAAQCEEPWKTLLTDHRDALVALSLEIAAASEGNRELLSAGYQGLRDTLAVLADTGADGYAADGRATTGPTTSRLIDRSI